MKHNEEQKKFLLGFGNRINKFRKMRGLSFRALSQRCDIDFADLNRIEKGKRNVTLLTVLELSKGLGIHPKELFDFDLPEAQNEKPNNIPPSHLNN